MTGIGVQCHRNMQVKVENTTIYDITHLESILKSLRSLLDLAREGIGHPHIDERDRFILHYKQIDFATPGMIWISSHSGAWSSNNSIRLRFDKNSKTDLLGLLDKAEQLKGDESLDVYQKHFLEGLIEKLNEHFVETYPEDSRFQITKNMTREAIVARLMSIQSQLDRLMNGLRDTNMGED